MPLPSFFLRDGNGYIRHFDESHELFGTFGAGASVQMFTTDSDHPKCMLVSTSVTNTGAEEFVSDIIPGIEYVFEAAYRVSGGSLKANLYDQVGAATIWTATALSSTNWANIYKRVTVPVACSVIRIRFQKPTANYVAYIDDIQLQGNSLFRDPDGYGVQYPAIGNMQMGANGIRSWDQIARHAQFSMNFPNTSATAVARLIKGASGREPAYFNDGNVISMTDYATVYVSKSYTFAGVSQGGGGATLFRSATTADRPVASTDMQQTEMANSQYAAIGADDDAAATLTLTPADQTPKYAYVKANFQATDYATTAHVRQFTVTLKAGADDESVNDENGVELYAWDGDSWTLLDTSRNVSKQTLTYTTADKEIAQRFVNTADNRIKVIAKSRVIRVVGTNLVLKVYHIKVGINDQWSRKLALTNKAILSATNAVNEVRNLTQRTDLANDTGYDAGDDRKSVIVVASAANGGDVIRMRYAQNYEVDIDQLTEPSVYGGDVTQPRGVGGARLVTLKKIG